MSALFDLSGKVAVVVGGTSGLGRTLALGLAAAGADVVPSGRREELARSACEEVVALGRRTLVHTADVGDRMSVDGLRDAVLGKFGQVDILLNAAGITGKRATAELPEADWQSILDTNLNGTLRCCQSFYEPLKKSSSGRIVNIASLSSFVGLYQVAAYCASKSAVLSLTRSLAIEWAADGINVNALVPGVFRTDLNAGLLDGTDRGKELLMRTPMKRFGNLQELIGATVFMASDAASFMTGQFIAVDGGFLASGVNT